MTQRREPNRPVAIVETYRDYTPPMDVVAIDSSGADGPSSSWASFRSLYVPGCG
jgi:hypothetical protein